MSTNRPPPSPRLTESTPRRTPSIGSNSLSNSTSGAQNHNRSSSIADLLSTPPPLHATTSSTTEYSATSGLSARRPSIASLSDDTSSVASVASSASSSQNPVDWAEIAIKNLVSKEKLVFVNSDTPVEKAFEILDKHNFTSLPVKDEKGNLAELRKSNGITVTTGNVWHMFDYTDLNAYLLFVLGKIEPTAEMEAYEYVRDAREGKPVPVKFVARLGLTDPFLVVPSTSSLAMTAEILGNGMHRIAIADVRDPNEIVGVLSQRRLVRYIWENGRRFKSLEQLFQTPIKDLSIGTSDGLMTVDGDDIVLDAFILMHTEGVSSVAVIDHQRNLLGNISVVDVRLVTKTSQSPLLRQTCKQFLSAILSQRGLVDGKDAYPVFYVTPTSTLGRTIAKLVATQAHRLWIVRTAKPASMDNASISSTSPSQNSLDQKLIGVVSLTDVLGLLARHAGKDQIDTFRARKQRRSSSSSVTRRSISITRG